MSMRSFGRWVLTHRKTVLVAWLLTVVIAIGLMPKALDQLGTTFGQPGAESSEANERILQEYGGTGGFSTPLVLVIDLPDGTTVDDPGVRDELNAAFARAQHAAPQSRLASWANTGDDGFVSEDRQTTFALVFLPHVGQAAPVGSAEIEQAMADTSVAGSPVLVTGRSALSSSSESGGAGVLLETVIGGVGALIVLLYVFGSALAIVPLLIAGCSILGSFLMIGAVASQIDINTVVQYIVSLMGLGIAIDYSLLIVTRWREERESGASNVDAVQTAVETAGHAVLFSGMTAGIGLLALVVLPVPVMRGLGIGGLVIPVVSVLAALTLLPVILSTIGPRMDWPRSRRKSVHLGHGWQRWTEGVIRHRLAATVIALVILGGLLIPASQITIGDPRPDALNGSADAEAGLQALEHSGIDAGVMNPFEVVVDGDPGEVADALTGAESVRSAVAPDVDGWRTDDGGLVVVLPQSDGGGESARETLGHIRDVTHGQDLPALVGGAPAGSADFEDAAYGNLPLMIAAVSIATFLLLAYAFRSIFLPIKAILLNILSVAATFGVLVIVWQWGWGSDLVWGIPSTDAITNWVPISVFAFLFGLSMDYEVFILARVREEYDETRDNDRAIVRGLGFTGRLVTCAALILFLAFAAMASGPETEIKIMATGLAAGILLDATVVRAFLVPALVSLMGHWNWWMPSWLGGNRMAPITEREASPSDAMRRAS